MKMEAAESVRQDGGGGVQRPSAEATAAYLLGD